MKKPITITILAALGAIALGALLRANDARALSVPVKNLRTRTVTCADTATKLVPAGNTPPATMRVWNNSATPVYLGGFNVATTSTGMPYCTDTATCLDDNQPMDVTQGYCIVASGTVDVLVLEAFQ